MCRVHNDQASVEMPNTNNELLSWQAAFRVNWFMFLFQARPALLKRPLYPPNATEFPVVHAMLPPISVSRTRPLLAGVVDREVLRPIPDGDVIFFTLHLLSVLISGSAVTYLLFNASLRRHPSVRILMPACSAEMVKALLSMVFHAYNGSHGGIQALGPTGCNAFGLLLYFGFPLTLYSTAAITFERHRSVVSLSASSKKFYAGLGVVLVITLAKALVRAFVGNRYVVSQDGLYCMADWASTSDADLVLTGLCLAFTSLGLGTLVVYQIRIFLAYYRAQREMHGVVRSLQRRLPALSYNQRASARAKQQERYLLFRMILLTVTILIAWTPYTFMITEGVLHHKRVKPMYDFVACLILVIAQMIVIIILLLCTPVVKASIVQHVHCFGQRKTDNNAGAGGLEARVSHFEEEPALKKFSADHDTSCLSQVTQITAGSA